MTTQFNIFQKSRELVFKRIENLTLEQLHTIPEGFNNNIIWNVAHLVVTQQLLHYKLSGLDCLVPDELITNFKKGTTPSQSLNEEEVSEIKDLLIGLPATLQEDYEAGIFQEYQAYPTSTGFELSDINTAIAFNNMHEGMHLGVIMALTKLV